MAEPTLAEMVAQSIGEMQPRFEDGRWYGAAPEHFGDTLFGGYLMGQCANVAARAVDEGRRVHSLHLYFLRPALAGPDIEYVVEPLRVGRSFGAYEVRASQAGKEVIRAMFSATTDVDGYDYQLTGPEVARPDEIGVEHNYGPWVEANIGPTPQRSDGTFESTRLGWQKVGGALGDDPALHLAFVAFLTDVTHTGARPTHNTGDTTGIVSLDHAIWFHREARADEWLLYDVESVINHGGRGVLRGVLRDEHGATVASVAQETRLFT